MCRSAQGVCKMGDSTAAGLACAALVRLLHQRLSTQAGLDLTAVRGVCSCRESTADVQRCNAPAEDDLVCQESHLHRLLNHCPSLLRTTAWFQPLAHA